MKDGIFQEDNTLPPKEESITSLFSLKGRTAIVSGSGAGIGYAVVQAFAEAGANAAIWVRHRGAFFPRHCSCLLASWQQEGHREGEGYREAIWREM